MRIDERTCSALLMQQDDILILCHRNPDGDTIGCAYALYTALTMKGKRARVACADAYPKMYAYLTEKVVFSDFEPKYVVAVDVADVQLLGRLQQQWEGKIDLSIDHHPSNTGYATYTLLDEKAAAAAQIIYRLIEQWGCEKDRFIANCIYTGVSTDTGCFKFENTQSETHMIAAKVMDAGAEYQYINKLIFETKSKNRIAIEQMIMDTLEFYFGDRCTLIHITQEMLKATNMDYDQLDGISAKPRQIEGVSLGITMREQEEGGYRVSMRSTDNIDAGNICKLLGGGGHARAAGCTIDLPFAAAKQKLLDTCAPFFA